jgi:hypothetical protein
VSRACESGILSNERALACERERRLGRFDVRAPGGMVLWCACLAGTFEAESGEFRVGGNRSTSFSCYARGPSPHKF